MEEKIRTVDNIAYLCCVSDTGEFYGIKSLEFDKWVKPVREAYLQSDELHYETWLIDKYIPILDKQPTKEIDLFTLPKVFKYKNNFSTRNFQKNIQSLSMDVSINFKDNLILVL